MYPSHVTSENKRETSLDARHRARELASSRPAAAPPRQGVAPRASASARYLGVPSTDVASGLGGGPALSTCPVSGSI